MTIGRAAAAGAAARAIACFVILASGFGAGWTLGAPQRGTGEAGPQPIDGPSSATAASAGASGHAGGDAAGEAGTPGLAIRSEAFDAARALLPRRFVLHETRRFVLLSDADPVWTRSQAERLERAYHQFHRLARRLALDPQPLRHKLVCVLFESREDYGRFAREQDQVVDPWIAGYYSPRFDRVVFYNVESPVNKAIETEEDPDAGSAAAGDRVGEGMDRLGSRFAAKVSIATTIHEAIHQLCFHTGVQSPRIQYPLWICEGLATSFETETPASAFGPEFEYAPRREVFVRLLREGELIPLRDLAIFTRIPDQREETVQAVYHQSYALVTWMARHRPRQLGAYLRSMRAEPPGRVTHERHLEIFEAAFGPVDRIETAWLRAERETAGVE